MNPVPWSSVLLGKATGVGGKLQNRQHRNHKEEKPFVHQSLQPKYMCVFETFPVVTYKKVQAFLLIKHAVSVALAVLGACWTMQ